MRFEWDESKNRRNLAKHGIDFNPASLVFADPNAVTRLDRIEKGEERWHTMGLSAGIVVILVVYTVREEEDNEIIRIISARKATPQERKAYDQAH